MSARVTRHRPTCKRCGFEDTATFSRTQLDVYDFACPECRDGGWIWFPLAQRRLSEHPGADAAHHDSARANPQDQTVKGEGPGAL